MSQTTAIEWTEATLNPWTGCTKVSPGCAHCYIDRTPPFRINGRKFEGGTIPLRFHLERLDAVLRRRKPTMYFVNSLSDVFHEDVPDSAILRLFDTMRACAARERGHVFQILTKRPERMRDFCLRLRFDGSSETGRIWLADNAGTRDGYALMGGLHGCSPLPNVWLGVSIENRRFVGRADVLRETPAAVRFISAEPLLGPLLPDAPHMIDAWNTEWPLGDAPVNAWRPWADGYTGPPLSLEEIDWLIVGGESGAGHRPIREEWVRDLKDHCEYECWQGEREGSTAFFFKQWGGRNPKAGGRELDGREWSEFPTPVAA